MSTSTSAALCDQLVYAAIAVFVIAMLVYAAEAARRASPGTTALRSVLVSFRAPGDAVPTTRHDEGSDRPYRTRRLRATAISVTNLGLLLNFGAVAARGFAGQRATWGNMYEFVLVAGVAAGAAFLVFLTRQPARELEVWIVLALGLAVTLLYTPVDLLAPVLNSYWLVIHAAAAMTSGGVFTVGVVAAVLLLVRSRADRRTVPGGTRRGYAATLPLAETLSRVSHTAHMFAFSIWTFAVTWAENSWGHHWGWDPKEPWAVHHLGALRGLPARPGDPELAGEQGVMVRHRQLHGVHPQLLWRQHVDPGAALLRRGVSDDHGRRSCAPIRRLPKLTT